MLTQEQTVEIRVMARRGESVRSIARELGCSRNTVRRYLRGEQAERYLRFPHIFHAASTTKRACSIEAGVGPDGAGGQPRLSTSQPIRQTLSVGRLRFRA